MTKGAVSQFITRHYRHFNAAALVDAARGYEAHLTDGGKMMVTLGGAMSTAELGISLAEMIRRDKVHIITCTGAPALEDLLKEYIRQRDNKPGNVFLGVVHRIDRPVSGVVIFAKTGKALIRMNEMIKNRAIRKIYWAVVEVVPPAEEGTLTHYLVRDGKTNKSRVYPGPVKEAKEARLNYRYLAGSKNYHLLEVELLTGRHHQIRAQLAAMGCPIRGDLKYGAARSNRDGSISLHARSLEFVHPVAVPGEEPRSVRIVAPVPQGDNLWQYFEESQS